MYDVLIFIKCSGENARIDNLSDTIRSIKMNIGVENYGIYLVVDSFLLNDISKLIQELEIKNKLVRLKSSFNSWVNDYNEFYAGNKKYTKWIMISHDDVFYCTKDFFKKTIEMVKEKEKEIGFITYTSDFYYKTMGRCIPNSIREGFHLDRKNYPTIFECHNMNKNLHWGGAAKDNLHLLDMPKEGSLVKCHAPMSTVMISTIESLEKIGPFDELNQKYTMLVDEDIGLMMLKQNLWNIWIPDIYINHPMRYEKRPTQNKYENESHVAFIKKWGFGFRSGMYSDGVIKEIQEQYKDTLIPWSSYFNSYDWQYL